jgi:integrase
MSKSPAGTPQVKLSNGRLQIVLTYGGKRKYLSLGLSESKQNRDYADMVRSWIQNDIRCNNFDPSLDRYRREDITTDPDKPKAVEPTIRELWDRYTNYKRPQLAPSTIAKDFDRVSIYIDRFPDVTLDGAVAVRDYLNLKTTLNTTKRV